MIHYHGTPIGGSKDNAARFLVGRHALVPFKYQQDLPSVMAYCQSFVVDNSAFSYWKTGDQLDVVAYAKWVKSIQHHPSFDWCLIPDKIDGDEKENMRMVQDWRNLLLKAKSVPVWHLHESLDYLDWLCNTFDTVAFGSSGTWAHPGSKSWWIRMSEAMSVACNDEGQPRAKFHGLRMLDPEIFQYLPLASADSTNAAVNSGSISRFGMYTPPTSSQRAAVIADRIERFNSAPIWAKNPEQQDLFV